MNGHHGAQPDHERRLQSLLAWRTRTILQGWPVPAVTDLQRIAIADDPMPPGIDMATVTPWLRTLSYLLVRMRQREPVDEVPDDLKRPDRGAPAASAAGPAGPAGTAAAEVRPAPSADAPRPGPGPGGRPRGGEPAVLRDLRRWRTENRSASPELRDLKDSHLRAIVRNSSTTASEVRTSIPRGLGEHAAELAEIVRQHVAPDDAVPGPVESDPVPAASPTPSGTGRAQEPGPGAASPERPHGAEAGRAPRRSAEPAAEAESAGATLRTGVPEPEPEDAGQEPNLWPPRHGRHTLGEPPVGGHPPAATSTGHAPAEPLPGPGTGPEGGPGPSGAAEAAPATPGVAPDPSEGEDLTDMELADGDYAPDPAPLRIRQELVRDATVLRWPDAESTAPVVLYRVVTADDDYRPHRPQDADAATVTTSTTWIDDRRFRSPVRHVQVWVHPGATAQAAAAAVPVLHAETRVVARLHEPRVVLNGRSVVGRWSKVPGVESVQVLRAPRNKARGVGIGDTRYWVNEDANLTGFVDDHPVPNTDYVYLVFVRASIDGAEVVSEPQRFPVFVPAVLEPVIDLRVALRRDPGRPPVLDLWWTPPEHCEVRIYLTPNAPEAGVTERSFELAELPRMGLTEQYLVPHPPSPAGDAEPGRVRVSGVEWPVGWTFAYVTAVAELDGDIWVGRSHLEINLPQVTNAQIVERTYRQVLMFDWPTGADNVLAFVGAPRQDLNRLLAERPEPDQISRDRYERQGGLHFRYPLPPGYVVHVMAQAYADGRSLLGPPVGLSYPGLHRLEYTVNAQPARKGGGMAVATVQIRSWAADIRTEVPQFTLVYRDDRLPLHYRDGESLQVQRAGNPQAGWQTHFRPDALLREPGPMAWNVALQERVGYLRLFVVPEPTADRVPFALIDPPMERLYLLPSASPHGGVG